MKNGKINVNKMVRFSFIMEDVLENKKIADSFFTVYEEFVKQIFNNNYNLLNSSYANWIKKRLKNRLSYRSFQQNDTDKVFKRKLKKDALLAVDIKKNGLNVPILIRSCSEDGFLNLDGAHRLIIYKVLDKKMIDYQCKEKLYEPCFIGMKKWIEDLNRGDFY